jgi:deoxycytidine triphosphate deaminase|tara:strand:+ start:2546 stop:3052 length:507 start_codon:yes stop_codon:yes gene_type:complete
MKHIASDTSESELSKFDAEQVQPNAIDLKIDKIFRLNSTTFEISEAEKVHRGSVLFTPDAYGLWKLDVGIYEIIMEGEINIGPNEAGFVITRSTLNRNGLFITSGLYDSGYCGVMAGALHVTGGPAIIKRGTRVGQFLLFEAESLNQYSGSYGSGSGHDAKYATGVQH